MLSHFTNYYMLCMHDPYEIQFQEFIMGRKPES